MESALLADTYIGKWKSEAGQLIVVRRLPFGRMFANYYPTNGWPRFLRDCTVGGDARELTVRLTWVFGTWLVLKPASNVEGRQLVLTPEFLSGPDGAYDREAHDCPWALPLTVFRKMKS